MNYRLLGVFLGLLSVATADPARGQWQDAPTDKQEINMQVPGMEHWTPGYWKTVDTISASRNTGIGHHSQWRSIEDRGIHAYLTYQTRKRSFYYVTVKDMIDISFGQDYDAQFEGNVEVYKSSNGKFEYIYFSIDTKYTKRKCVGFVNMSRSRKKIVYGHYCLSGYEPMDKDLVGLLIDSIDLNFQGSASTSTPSAGPSEIGGVVPEKIRDYYATTYLDSPNHKAFALAIGNFPEDKGFASGIGFHARDPQGAINVATNWCEDSKKNTTLITNA